MERLGSAMSNARKTLQRGRTTEAMYGGSPGKTTSYSISPKKPGKDSQPLTAWQGIKKLHEVRYANPRQGNKLAPGFGNSGGTQYGGAPGANNGYYRRENSANKTGGLGGYDR